MNAFDIAGRHAVVVGAGGEHMIAAGGGALVNLSSVCGRFGAKFGQTEYSASKGAVDALTRSLAAQWAEYGIRVNAGRGVRHGADPLSMRGAHR